MNYQEITQKRESYLKAILQGWEFLSSTIEDGGAAAKHHDVKKKQGIWTSAEVLELLLTTKALPVFSLSGQIDSIVDFLISKYNTDINGWSLTVDNDGVFSAVTTGHCVYALKLYLNEYINEERRRKIIDIVSDAESSIIAAQDSQRGYWLPGAGDAPTGLNYGRLFYSCRAYYGIRKVDSCSELLPASDRVLSARRKANGYFCSFANELVQYVRANDKLNDDSKVTILGHTANLIQVLSDIDENGNANILADLYQIVSEFMAVAEKTDYKVMEIPVHEVQGNLYNTYHLNTAFSVFFAALQSSSYADCLVQIADWYLDRQDPTMHCWYINNDRNLGIDTWTSCDALLVLSYAYTFCYEKYFEFELLQVKKKYEHCEDCKKKIDTTLRNEQQNANKKIKKAKRSMVFSVVVTLFIALCAIAALVFISIVKDEPWINVIITAVVIPVILQIISILKIPELPEISEESKNILSMIDEEKI